MASSWRCHTRSLRKADHFPLAARSNEMRKVRATAKMLRKLRLSTKKGLMRRVNAMIPEKEPVITRAGRSPSRHGCRVIRATVIA